MFSKTQFSFLTLCFVVVVAGRVYGTPYTITGKVVDLKGRPIVGAEVLIEETRGNWGIDRLRYPATTNISGEFNIVKKTTSGTAMYVYITPPKTQLGINLFNPSWSAFVARAYPQLFRRTITLGGTRKMNLGTLTVDLPFTPARILIERQISRLVTEHNLFDYWLVVEDIRGKQVAEGNFGTLSNKNVLNDDGTVDVVLPKGLWKIKVCDSGLCEKKTLGISRFTRVGNKPVSIVVKQGVKKSEKMMLSPRSR